MRAPSGPLTANCGSIDTVGEVEAEVGQIGCASRQDVGIAYVERGQRALQFRIVFAAACSMSRARGKRSGTASSLQRVRGARIGKEQYAEFKARLFRRYWRPGDRAGAAAPAIAPSPHQHGRTRAPTSRWPVSMENPSLPGGRARRPQAYDRLPVSCRRGR